ncbi:putative scramblase [Septoria linicola]|nr:putative scramblase [Septoria linicola]
MSAARWSLRLPRAVSALSLTTEGRAGVTRVQQRRWIRKPPPRNRPWASIPKKDGDEISRREDGSLEERASNIQRQQHGETQSAPEAQQSEQAPNQTTPGRNTQLAATLAEADTSDLVTEVRIPDDPYGVLPPDHPATAILSNSSLVIQRQIELMNIMIGFEQANRYIIMDGQGQTIGYIAEQDHGMGSAFKRQMFATHRSFTTHIFDKDEREVLRIHRPFAWINSRIRIYDPVPEGGYAARELSTSTALQGTSASSAINQSSVAQISPLKLEEMRVIGETKQIWAALRRKYAMATFRPSEDPSDPYSVPRIEFNEQANSDTKAVTVTESKTNEKAIEAGMRQFAHVDEPFLSWDFTLRNESEQTIGSVNRNFVGFAREIFTDTGVYALRMDSAAQQSLLQDQAGHEIAQYEREATAMTLDQRAVMLATAVCIDFDYFSRHSGGTGIMPMWLPFGMGGTAAEGGAAAGGAVGAAEGAGAVEGAAGAAGRAGGAMGAGEGAIAGAGSMAGYEAMQRGVHGPRGGDDASPTANEPFAGEAQNTMQDNAPSGDNDVWGESQDPWGRGGPGDGPPPPSAGGEGDGEGGGGLFDALSDFFGDD